MLAADKLQLQSSLKQQATALKEKEFNLHHNNFMTVGTQAAVLAGLDVTMFIEFQPPPNSEWGAAYVMFPRMLKFLYYVSITSAFCANILVVSQTTIVSVLGSSLALRGPDGSMVVATDGMYDERGYVFKTFGLGLGLTLWSVVMCVWLHLHFESSLVCFVIALCTIRAMRNSYKRIFDKFDFDDSMTVDFTDIFDGPASIRLQEGPSRRMKTERNGSRKAHRSFDSHEGLAENESSDEGESLKPGRYFWGGRRRPSGNDGNLQTV